MLPVEMFDEHVKICLGWIIENGLVDVDFAHIRDYAPLHLYEIFIKKYLEDENCWKHFFINILGMVVENILKLSDSPLPTLGRIYSIN